MLNNYELVDISIGIIDQGKNNAGQKYISGRMKNMRYRMERKQGFTLFREMDEERFDAILNAFPMTGQDMRNPQKPKPWNGGNTSLPATFKYEDAIEELRNLDGWNALMFENCEYERFPLPGLYVRKYTQPLGGHAEGEWVMEPNGSAVAVVDHIDVLTMKMEDGTPLRGWDAETQARSQMKTLIRLEDALKGNNGGPMLDVLNNPCKVAERYMPGAERMVPGGEAIDDK